MEYDRGSRGRGTGAITSTGTRRLSRRVTFVVVALVLAVATGGLPVGPRPPTAGAAGPCDAPIVSPVACENTLPGNPKSEWDVSGAGDLSIQGFATDMSVNKGETVRFKVKTTATLFRIDLYRLGYYGGNGARKVATVGPLESQSQPACLTQSTTGLVDCGNWGVSATWPVPSSAVSGIHVARLVRTDTGGASHILFVVRDDASTSDVLLQTSDTTWAAYNNYGGNSLYEGAPAGRAYKVSYNRPNIFRGHPTYGFGNFFADEYPMVRWIEANGYDVTYTSGVDSDRRGTLIQQHKVFISSGHDEYWSGAQRANVEAARAAGVHLAFFSGNEVFWKTRWEASIDGSGTSHRTLVSYKETHAGAKIDPEPATWTGTWRDPRFSPPADGGRPENALTGTIFTVNCCHRDAIMVPAEDGKLRLWRNTSVATLAPGATATLASGTLGYEFDEDLDNGFRPPGLIRLSRTTLSVPSKLKDFGSTYGAGTATHSLTLYRHASGALVFGAGTVRWAFGLDGVHDDGPSTPDPRMQQATVNLLADMGAQPVTLQAGLVAAVASTDTTAPTATITSPAAGTTVPNGGTVTITGTATDVGGRVGGVEVSTDGGTTWHPASGRDSWRYSWSATGNGPVTVRARATDDSLNAQATPATVSLNVTCPCQIFGNDALPAVTAADDSSALELGVKFRSDVDGFVTGVRFYKGIGNTGTHVGKLWSPSGSLLASATFTNETSSGWQQVSFSAAVPVTANTTYVASYHAPNGHYAIDEYHFLSKATDSPPLHALKNGEDGGNGVYLYGPGGFPVNAFRAANYWVDPVFTTTLGPDTTPPTVTTRTPSPGASNVSTSTTVRATFSEPVDPATISFLLRDPANATVPATLGYDGPSRTATLTPSSALATSTTYTATVSGARDLAGNTMTPPVNWTFTTAGTTSPPGGCPCSLWDDTVVPANPSSSDTAAVELGVKFSADIDGSVTGIRFYKGSGNTGTHTGSLWSASGTRLATATFTNETASGWQQVSFATPVAIAAGTTYIASYHAPNGHYAGDTGYFNSEYVKVPLRAPSSGAAAGNGVYRYGASAFPNQAFNAANYWVDVVFTTAAAADTTPPTVTSRSPAAGATGVARDATATATFSESVSAGSIVFTLRDPANNPVAGTVSYDDASRTATFNPTSLLAEGATYTASVTATDLAGNAMTSPSTWSFTTAAAADTTPPTVTSRSPAAGATGVARDADATATFSESVNASSVVFTLRDPANNVVAATVTYDDASRTATFNPTSLLAADATYTASVTATDLAGNAMTTPATWSFTTAAAADTTPPTVTSQTPAPGATGVARDTDVTATFSESVSSSSIVFTLRDPANNSVAGSVTYDDATRTVTLNPTGALARGTTYTVSVTAIDLAGNAMTSPSTWSFTTAGAPPRPR